MSMLRRRCGKICPRSLPRAGRARLWFTTARSWRLSPRDGSPRGAWNPMRWVRVCNRLIRRVGWSKGPIGVRLLGRCRGADSRSRPFGDRCAISVSVDALRPLDRRSAIRSGVVSRVQSFHCTSDQTVRQTIEMGRIDSATTSARVDRRARGNAHARRFGGGGVRHRPRQDVVRREL